MIAQIITSFEIYVINLSQSEFTPKFHLQSKNRGTVFAVIDFTLYWFTNTQHVQQEYLVYGYFRQRWKDSRLTGRLNYTLTIKGGDIDNIWVPDPYCYNARESNMMLLDTQLHSRISIDPSGDVLYSKG